jgi:hypothetical protein
MTMERLRRSVLATGMVGSPLLVLAYWLTYPAYGELHAAGVSSAIAADPGMTRVADAFGLAGTLLAVPWALGYVDVIGNRSRRLALVGAALSILGWMSVLALFTLDAVAVQLADHPDVFKQVYSDGFVVTLNAIAGLHIIGAVLIGVAVTRSGLVPRGVGIALVVAAPVHFAANVSGLLAVDAMTWVVTAAVGIVLLKRRGPWALEHSPLPTSGLRAGEQSGYDGKVTRGLLRPCAAGSRVEPYPNK